MGAFADNLARLHVAAAAGVAAPDLIQWCAEVIGELAPVAARIAARNVLLRQAAARVSGSRLVRARRVEREIRALGSPLRTRSAEADDGVRELVARALENAPAPETLRHLRRILG